MGRCGGLRLPQQFCLLHRFLRQAALDAGANLDRVQLCGLLPQMPGILPVLLGMGYSSFSVEPSMIPYLAADLLRTDVSSARLLADQVCAANNGQHVRRLLGLA